MKQSLLSSLLLTLSIIFAAPPAWADDPTVGDPNTDYFTITNVSASSAQIYLKKNFSTTIKVDTLTSRAETWGAMTVTTSTYLTIPAGGYAKFRVNTTWTHATNSYIYFADKSGTRGNTWELSGDLMTLVSNTYVSSVPTYAFYSLFNGVTHLKSISNLKLSSTVTSLEKGALQKIFYGCTDMSGSTLDLSGITGTVKESALQDAFYNCSTLTSITSLPQATEIEKNGCYRTFYCCKNCTISEPSLPASKIGKEGCYAMFSTCQKITTAPDITTTSLGINACKQMFTGCIRLETAPTLTQDTITQGAYFNMFNGCTSLTNFGDINASVIGVGACDSMFYGCTGLEEFGDINATTIQKYGCSQMFWGCSGLTSVGNINVTKSIGDKGCYKMFYQCSNLATIGNLHATSIGDYGCNYMFSECKKLNDCSGIVLDVDTIKNYTYSYMFADCYGTSPTRGISKAPQIAAKVVGTYSCNFMFYRCSLLTTPPDTLHAKVLYEGSYYSMFQGAVKLESSPVIMASSMPVSNNSTKGALGKMFYSYNTNSSLANINVRFKNWNTYYYSSQTNYYTTYQWVEYTKGSGVFTCPSALPTLTGNATKPTNFTWNFLPSLTFDAGENAELLCLGHEAGDGVRIDSIDGEGTFTQAYINSLVAQKTDGSGLVFTGWLAEGDDTPLSASHQPTTSTSKQFLVYHAQFASSVTYTFHRNNGTWGDSDANEAKELNSSVKTGSFPAVSRANYTFVGWNTSSTGDGTTYALPSSLPDENKELYAIWTPNYTFDVNTNGGTWDGEHNNDSTWASGEAAAKVAANTPVKAGYRFVKWHTTTTGTGGDDFDLEDIPSGPTTYYAIFTPIYTFAPNGGTWNGESTTDKEFYGSFELPSIARNGYTFNGWEDESGNELDMEDLPSAPTTYTAQWTAINYTFDVATNEGAWSDESTADSVRTISGITALTTPQKDKFTFERWNTSEDGTGTDMDASALPTTATKYYAIFIKVDYFRFIAQNATTIGSTKYNIETPPSLSYSTDNGATWNTFTIGTTSVVLAAGDSVCFRGVNANGLNRNCKGDSFKQQPASPYWYFTSTDSVSVAGNIMTLVQGTNPTNTIPATNCFAAIMKGMPLVSAAKLQLPSSTYNGCYKYMFYNSSIRIAPELPALHVADSAYQGMFSNCQSLKIAPEIPATTVGVASMRNMFYECFALKQAPSELKAIQLYAYTYRGMFWECKQLQTSPIIRATTMPTPASSDVAAMSGMFRKCSTLVNVSVRMKTWNYVSSSLSATYYWLSYGSSTGTLTCPSALPTATRNDQTLPENWTVNYIPELTFDVNTNGGTWEDESTTARVLEPETTWTIPTDVTAPSNRTFVGWNTAADGTGDWLTVDNQPVISATAVIRTYYAIYAMNLTFNVASVGATWDGSANDTRTYTDVQFRRGEIPSPLRGEDEVRTAWVTAGGDTLKANSVLTPNTVYTPRFAEYLCITAQVDNVNVGISSIGGTIPFNLYYSTDGMNWTNANASTAFVTLNENQKVYLRGTNASGINNATNYPSNKYVKFNVTNNAIVSGNIMYLIHPTNPPTTIPNTHCFAKLFKHDSNNSIRYCKITDASRLKLPATTLTESCYEGLFHDCQYLIYAPKLPATELAANCYKQMFYNCSALRRMEVSFTGWNDDGSGNSAYTLQWMYGTTTNAEHNARFIGPAVLFEHDRDNGHIQLNWKGMDFELLDDQDDAYYTALKDMDGIGLQQITFKGTFPAKRWITFNVPFDFYIPEDHPFADHVYQFLGADGNADEGFDIHFQGGVYELEAGMPYLYYGDETLTDFVFAADGENNTILTIDADALEAESVWPTNPEINTSGAEYRSTVKMTSLPGGDKHYIYLSRNSLYYPHALGNTLYAFSGYFYVPSTGSIAPRVRMMVNGVETNVQVEGLGAEEQAAQAGTKKYILDGTLVIERNGIRYDAHGHKLN